MNPALEAFRLRLVSLIGKGTVSAFARQCGITDSLMRKYLEGGEPGLTKLVAIANGANVSIEWLATGHESSPEYTTAGIEAPDCAAHGLLSQRMFPNARYRDFSGASKSTQRRKVA
jgi:transcriptional regulator with XRE-family HTH domain